MDCDLTLNVYVQNNDEMNRMQRELLDAIRQKDEAILAMKRLEIEVVGEKQVNMELCDLLRANGIRFRKTAEMRNWHR